MPRFLTLLAALVAAVSLQGKPRLDPASPLQKVVELLESLERQVTSEGEAEARLYAKYEAWCTREEATAGDTITSSGEAVEDATAAAEEQAALITQLQTGLSDLRKEQDVKSAQLSELGRARTGEHSAYLACEHQFTDDVDSLRRALAVMRRKLGSESDVGRATPAQLSALARNARVFSANELEGDLSRREREGLARLFGRAVDAAAASATAVPAPHATVLLQQFAGADGAGGSVPASPAVVDMLQQLLEKAEEDKEALMKEEISNKSAFNKQHLALSNEIAAAKDGAEQKGQEVQKATQVKAENDRKRQVSQGDLDRAQKYSASLQQGCLTKKRDWKIRVGSRSAELHALGQAKRILTSDAARMVTGTLAARAVDKATLAHASLTPPAHASRLAEAAVATLGDDASDVTAPTFLQLSTVSSSSLRALASSAGPFDSVKQMIQSMIVKLLNKQASEQEQHSWCSNERAKSQKQLLLKKKEQVKLETRKEELQAALSELVEETRQLQAASSAAEQAVVEAEDQRRKEKRLNLDAIAQYSDAGKLVSNAIVVLKGYYDQQALVQLSAEPEAPPKTTHGGEYDKSGTSSGIIKLLEEAAERYGALEDAARSGENAADQEWDTVRQEMRVAAAARQTRLEHNGSMQVKLEGALHRCESDLTAVVKERATIDAYLGKLRQTCDASSVSHEERAARREQEIDSLKDTLRILESELA